LWWWWWALGSQAEQQNGQAQPGLGRRQMARPVLSLSVPAVPRGSSVNGGMVKVGWSFQPWPQQLADADPFTSGRIF